MLFKHRFRVVVKMCIAHTNYKIFAILIKITSNLRTFLRV